MLAHASAIVYIISTWNYDVYEGSFFKKVGNTKLNGHILRRVLLSVFCGFIGIVVAFVMFRVYNPNQNNLGALSSVCMDLICMIILFILIGSFAFGNYGTNRTTWLFAILLVATIWALFTDFLNWAFDGSLEFGQLTFWFTVGSLCMGSILGCIFCAYLYSYMEETHGLSQMFLSARICVIVNLISFVVTFILALTGTAFKFVDGHYETGILYDGVTILPVLSLIYLTGYVIRYVKKVGLHDVFAVAGYIAFMIAGALIEAENSIGTTYVAVTIADIFIFVMLQNEIIALEKRNVQKWMKKSNTDELTGFYNRNAYEADIENLEKTVLSKNFAYVSVDVNSLKTVNDSQGHYAGDELLIGAAECLKKCFGPYGKLYRIGGDEFIAMIDIEKEHLATVSEEIKNITANWNGKYVKGIALSCGYVTKAEAGNMSVRQMAILADHRMYEDKEEYYRRTGIERRRK